MREQHVIYSGPPRKGWIPYYCYIIQIRQISPRVFHIGTRASHNEALDIHAPTPLRIRSLRRFFDWFTPAPDYLIHDILTSPQGGEQ